MAMKTSDTIRVDNLREVTRAIRRAGDTELRKALRVANKSAAGVVKDESTERVPRRSGRLAGSIGVRASADYADVKAGSATRVPYAGVIHYGWPARRIEAQPFIISALAAKRLQVRDEYVAAMDHLADELNRLI